jgi:hypothetical protein
MEKESHGELHEGTTQNEMEMAKEQEELNENRYHHYEKDFHSIV